MRAVELLGTEVAELVRRELPEHAAGASAQQGH